MRERGKKMGKERKNEDDKRACSGHTFILEVLGQKNISKEIPAYEPFLHVESSISTVPRKMIFAISLTLSLGLSEPMRRN